MDRFSGNLSLTFPISEAMKTRGEFIAVTLLNQGRYIEQTIPIIDGELNAGEVTVKRNAGLQKVIPGAILLAQI